MSEQSLTCLPDVFWGEIAPCEHIISFYERDDDFLDCLEGYVMGGLHRRDSVILIATPVHLKILEQRLNDLVIDVTRLKKSDQYITLDAEETLKKFMVNDWPDEFLFKQTIDPLLLRARKCTEHVLVFGEMVAILWSQGLQGATVALEQLWLRYCVQSRISLFCAYPKTGLTVDMTDSLNDICNSHSKIYKSY